VIRHQIAIVDDDDLALGVLRRMITQWGYEAVPFRTFEAARGFIMHTPPDALVVDVRLGSYNGLQLVHLAKQASADVIVVVVSGFDDAVLRAEAERAGATFLVKPVDSAELRRHLPQPVG
jgi:DNA-binding response OmpR family regulator